MTVVAFCGIFGNIIVIWMFSREQSLRTSSNMFIVNLAISDCTFCVVNGFPLMSLSAFNKRWIFGQAACEFYGLIGGIFGIMSINTNAMIAIDRYMAIARPIHVAKFMTRKRAFFMIIIVWILSLVTCLPPIFGWGRYIPEGFQTSCTFDYLTRTENNRTYIIFMYILGFAAPLTTIIVCYFMIVRAVMKHEQEMKKTAKKMNAEIRTNQEEKRMEIKVAKISIMILCLYLLSWLPYATIALIAQFGDPMFVTPFWSEIPVLFAKASSMHNPLVYAFSHPKFRKAVQARIPWLLCCCEPTLDKTPQPSGTYRAGDRSASRRSQSSVTGAASLDSEMSNLSDATTYQDMEFRLRKLEEKTGTAPKRNSRRRGATREKSYEMPDEIPTGRIIQDLTHALIEVAGREKQVVRPVYLPGNTLQNPSNASAPGQAQTEMFVLDSTTLPQLAKYLAQFSTLNSASAGHSNAGMDMSPETPSTEVVGNGGGAHARANYRSNDSVDEAL
ncbi:hypothetical protein DPMN_033182 [Dreissena polymorpha]|uniref:G-protein coupled receptors family 1 profile domain-containing protein n=2 Tax=Dreissena polymorpha TaxID=45954 RepID=A0A9D4M595_DREPO|nr:hypothetical protein DPMN_033182 [Dreissena polymorpha]